MFFFYATLHYVIRYNKRAHSKIDARFYIQLILFSGYNNKNGEPPGGQESSITIEYINRRGQMRRVLLVYTYEKLDGGDRGNIYNDVSNF